MPDPSNYRPPPGSIPTYPGVYKFRDQHGRVIYVGKAKNLRLRLNSYFADVTKLHTRTYQMVTTAASVEWTVVTTEVEALQLEYNWIKEFDPRFNVRYRDDKTYPMLAVSLSEKYPRLFVYRGPRRKGVRYFGPYSHAWAIRDTLDLLARVFPARTCSAGVFKRHHHMGRPCLLGYINKCSCPCIGRVTTEEHRDIVYAFCDFLAGKTDRMIADVEHRMRVAAEELDFEKAARLRDDATALRCAMEKQAVVLGDGTDADVVSVVFDELETSVQVFHVRDGRVRGQRGWVVERTEDSSLGTQVEQFLTQFYGAQASHNDIAAMSDNHEIGESVPREVLVPELPEDSDRLEMWLSKLRGSSVNLRVPRRGSKRELMATVERNAAEALVQHKLRRAGDLTSRAAALTDIQEYLGMDSAPLRIECIDISHVQGTDVVASLVVFEDGSPRKSEYRRYSIKEAAGKGRSNDVASIAEVTRRRFLRNRTKTEPTGVIGPKTGKYQHASYLPNLFVVDGGAPQANVAAAVLEELGIIDVSVVGLSKRMEEIWVPGDHEPVIMPRNSEGLFLMQRVRDEAHRFALTFHRSKRSKRMTTSMLDTVPGLGPTRRIALVKAFGSVANISAASLDEIAAVPGIGPTTAKSVSNALALGKQETND